VPSPRIADYLGNSGSYAAARDLQQTVLGTREQTLDPKHPDTLTARLNFAHWTGQARRPSSIGHVAGTARPAD
jgi:hypothetical protein